MPKIAHNAVVEDSAVLAEDVRVGPFCYIGPEVEIAKGCVIHDHVTVVGKTRLGASTEVFPMAVIGSCGVDQDQPGCNQVLIGEGNEIREHVTIYAGQSSPTQIGARNLVMIGAQIGAGALVGDDNILVNFTQIGSEAKIEDFVRTSGFTYIESGVRVGDYTFTAAYADIDRDVPPFAMVQGAPFRVRGVNTHNLKRCGFSAEDIRALKMAFREIFNGSGIQADKSAIARILAEPEINPHVRRLVSTVGSASDGKVAHE
jgi:UDP-N-acetylglucosamine acyltransferase